MKGSLIQWTDNTYNPWLGCRKVAPECEKCYIVRQTPLRVRGIKHGAERHRCAESTLRQPLAWNNEAAIEGVRRRVFCLSLGDWLDNEVPIEWLADLLVMIRRCQNLDWQLLTKRPQNWSNRIHKAFQFDVTGDLDWLSAWLDGEKPSNIWMGVSAGADQAKALEIPAKIHFLSCEPMLHLLDTTHAARFDWIIFGGESEPGGDPRPFNVIHLDQALSFCARNKVPAFVKQMGGAPIYHHDVFDDGWIVTVGWGPRVTFPGGCTIKLNDGHGGDMEQWPARFQVREFPKV